MIQIELGSLFISTVTLLSLLYSISSVIDKQKKEWDKNEMRLLSLETSMAAMLVDAKQISSMSTKLNDISAEITRLRDRLDRFIDRGGN